MWNLLLFHGNNGYANPSQYYITVLLWILHTSGGKWHVNTMPVLWKHKTKNWKCIHKLMPFTVIYWNNTQSLQQHTASNFCRCSPHMKHKISPPCRRRASNSKSHEGSGRNLVWENIHHSHWVLHTNKCTNCISYTGSPKKMDGIWNRYNL